MSTFRFFVFLLIYLSVVVSDVNISYAQETIQKTGIEKLKNLAEQGNAEAQLSLGVMYYIGRDIPQNYGEAKKWYEKAANQGNLIAQNNLGAMYASGYGVVQNYALAKKLYEKAAISGFSGAQYNLGRLYANGNGTPQDYVLAHKWLNLAAANMIDGAAEDRHNLESVMLASQIAEAQRLARRWNKNDELYTDTSSAPGANALPDGFVLDPQPIPTFRKLASNENIILDQKVSPALEEKNIRSWPWWLILLVPIFITWGIGLTPPLLVRYVFLKRPVSKKYAFIICVLFFVLNLLITIALGNAGETNAVLWPIAALSYWILRRPHSAMSAEKMLNKVVQIIRSEKLQNSMYPLSIKDKITGGSSVDQMPHGVGDFGRSTENPIPVNGTIGELVYLSCLKTQDNEQRLLYHRLGSIDDIDIYETVTIDGQTWDILFFSMCHSRKSKKAPTGYSIINIKELRLLYGTNRWIDNFPYGLQDAVRETTKDIFGIPIRPPEIRHAEESIKFQRPSDHEDNIQSLLASIGGFTV